MNNNIIICEICNQLCNTNKIKKINDMIICLDNMCFYIANCDFSRKISNQIIEEITIHSINNTKKLLHCDKIINEILETINKIN